VPAIPPTIRLSMASGLICGVCFDANRCGACQRPSRVAQGVGVSGGSLKSRTENFLPDYRLISKTKSTSTTTPHEASLHENASMDEGSIEEASRQEHANQYVLLNQVTRHSEKCFGDVGLGLCDESCCNVKVVFSRVVAMKRSRGGARPDKRWLLNVRLCLHGTCLTWYVIFWTCGNMENERKRGGIISLQPQTCLHRQPER
jgi:hypothetical protein